MAVQLVDESVGVVSRELLRDKDEAIRRLPEFVLLVGDKEVEQAHFEDQMRCLGNSLRAGGHTVYTAVLPGKSHSTTIRHLGAVRNTSETWPTMPTRMANLRQLISSVRSFTLNCRSNTAFAGANSGHHLPTVYGEAWGFLATALRGSRGE